MGLITAEELALKELRKPLDRGGFIPREELVLRDSRRHLDNNYPLNYNTRGQE